MLSLFFAAASTFVRCQTVIPSPDYNVGWPYYCSDDNAPPLCNSQCTTAINRLCNSGNLSEALTATEQDCTIKHMPPVWPTGTKRTRSIENRNAAHPTGVDPSVCLTYFNQILLTCGKDAGSPASTTVNQSYCTTSGGGGTYGWNDDGSVMDNDFGRYIVIAANTNQCGQAEASWKQGPCIEWNDTWVQPGDQVILDTNPPPLTGAAAAAATEIPTPNPECDTEVCNIFGNPYYARSPVAPWPEKKGMMRHRIVYEGWSEDTGSTRLFHSLHDRCGVYPDNFQAYLNGTGPQRVADFNLPYGKEDLCWCIPDAIFDASVGITMPRNSFCGTTVLTDAQGNNEFVPVDEYVYTNTPETKSVLLTTFSSHGSGELRRLF